MVGCSLTHRGEELLGQRKGLEEYARSGSTFGIPFLHPWANRLSGFGYAVGGQEVALDRDSPLLRIEEHGLPIHGLRPSGLAWEVEERGGGLRATAEFDGERLEGFPFPHRLALEVTLADDGLTLETTLTPTSATPVPISFGYHPYLALPGAPRAEWEVDLPVERHLVLDENLDPDRRERDARRSATACSRTARSTTATSCPSARGRSRSPAAGARSASSSSRATRTRRRSPPRATT